MGVKVDYRALEEFKDNLGKLTAQQNANFTEAAVKELALRLLAKVKERTPVKKLRRCFCGRIGNKFGATRRPNTKC